MKLREFKNMPVFNPEQAEIIGKAERGVLGDDFQLLYLVVELPDGRPGMIASGDFEVGRDAIVLSDADKIKSYAHGEELSIYRKKMGDVVFSRDGQELGVVSDFVLNEDSKSVEAVEISAGALSDILQGRREYPLEDVYWVSPASLLVDEQGGGQA